MKLVTYLLITLLFLTTLGCIEDFARHPPKVTAVQRYPSDLCHYDCEGFEFIDECNKFQIGDTIYVTKTRTSSTLLK